MIDFDNLSLSVGEPLQRDKWNGLLEDLRDLPVAMNRNDHKVGVGITSPEAKLHIVNKNEDATHNNGGSTLILGPTNQSNLRLGYHQDYSWIQSHASKPLAINPLGNDVSISNANGTVSVPGKLRLESASTIRLGPWEMRQSGGGSNKSYFHFDRWSGSRRQPDRMKVDWSGNLEIQGVLTTGTKLMEIVTYRNLGNNVRYKTPYSTSTWSACIAGFRALQVDINENGKGDFIQLYMYASGGRWHIRAELRSHQNDHENWTVYVLFVRKTIAVNKTGR